MRKIKLITLLLVGLLAFGLTACSDPSTPEKIRYTKYLKSKW